MGAVARLRRPGPGLLAFIALLGCTGGMNPGPEAAGATPQEPVGLALVHDPGTCLAQTVDRDLDGLEDACELEVARAFAPVLITSPTTCLVRGELPGGGYAFAVGRGLTQDYLFIGYAPAYFRDCGWSGRKCWLRLRGGCDGHWGDSEFIGLIVGFDDDSQRWAVREIFLSAHCFGSLDASCRWYRGTELEAFAWEDGAHGAPHIWVAEGKNANYPTRERCERGHWWFDTCERNDRRARFPIRSAAQNVGQPWAREAPGGPSLCFTLTDLAWTEVIGPGGESALECFGNSAPFDGWSQPSRMSPLPQPEGAIGSTPYSRYFRLLWERAYNGG